ncbi:uncharacterized protein LOC106178342 [Lingula anatina]|uniref:Uncharacterized protein LOC106178342 n=1 Tax=Lingula anatina TaxID=7574 RepID=A0A1S3K329_LINAN|nr:uncharacterized protein LOC106178342 [Lingula anatina]XP_013416932.1 uncharacterized protein LOC106178342 [Lingula anatina]|eukprot:XP_013416931.1 uncharacterized protein LOC106178342 [Lingula anatina]
MTAPPPPVIPEFSGLVPNPAGTGLFTSCTSPSHGNLTTAVMMPKSCADDTRCVTNFLFLFMGLSSQVCLCPLTSTPNVLNGTCDPIQGRACLTSDECNILPFDCVGLDSWNITAAYDPVLLKAFLRPLVFYICSNTVEYRTRIPLYVCAASQCQYFQTAAITPFDPFGGGGGLGRKKRDVDEELSDLEVSEGQREDAVNTREKRQADEKCRLIASPAVTSIEKMWEFLFGDIYPYGCENISG